MRATLAEFAAQLTPQQRVFLFCVASGTDWKLFKIQSPKIQLAVLKNSVERRDKNGFVVTDLGRAVIDVLLQEGPR